MVSTTQEEAGTVTVVGVPNSTGEAVAGPGPRDPQQGIVCTLTSPWDAVATLRCGGGVVQTWDRRGDKPPSEENVTSAVGVLVSDDLASFNMRETRFCDPPIVGQGLSLFSFVPAKNAMPDTNGVFGFAKIRGCFQEEADAMDRCKYLIRDVDSYHSVQTVRTGQPFPVVADARRFSRETSTVDMEKETGKQLQDDVKARRDHERSEIEGIKKREAEIRGQQAAGADTGGEEDESSSYGENPLERYTTLRMKRAQLLLTLVETKAKILEIRKLAWNTIDEVNRKDAEDPTFRNDYLARIASARKEIGIDDMVNPAPFFAFLGDDVDITAIFSAV